MVQHLSVTDTALEVVTTQPTGTPVAEGLIKVWNRTSNPTGRSVYMAIGGAWVYIGGTAMVRSGTPQGNLTPEGIGQVCVSTSGNETYVAYGTGIFQWSFVG